MFWNSDFVGVKWFSLYSGLEKLKFVCTFLHCKISKKYFRSFKVEFSNLATECASKESSASVCTQVKSKNRSAQRSAFVLLTILSLNSLALELSICKKVNTF